MKALFFPLLLTLAACQSTVPFEPVSDQCKSMDHLSKVGTKAEDLSADAFPPGTRIIHPDTAVTRDFRPDRLNVYVNDKGRVERIDCG
ncbi:MAG TPA: I78 family peptidase inhibitor [Burkholderiaceae bacterium]|nr:I78 family peptidase inhibitor [Burkholderiaceae bacterium]